MGGRQAGVVAELVHQPLHRIHLIDDGAHGLGQHSLFARFQTVHQLHFQTLGRELDGRERILDFMGQTARHLGPGLRALRRNQRRHILEHQQAHIADGGIGQQCAPQYQRDHVMLQAFVRGGVELQRMLPVLVRGLAGPALIHLRRRFAPRHIDCVGRLRLLMLDQALELLLHRLPHLMQIGNVLEPVAEQLRSIDAQNAAGSRVGRQHRAIGGEQHHAGTQVVQNGLQF